VEEWNDGMMGIVNTVNPSNIPSFHSHSIELCQALLRFASQTFALFSTQAFRIETIPVMKLQQAVQGLM
jgi:hypothetical protein